MTTTLSFGTVPGLTGEEQQQLTELTEAYNYHQYRNAIKDKYYEGHISLNDVNLRKICVVWKSAATGGRRRWTHWHPAVCSMVL